MKDTRKITTANDKTILFSTNAGDYKTILFSTHVDAKVTCAGVDHTPVASSGVETCIHCI